jgi:hypothetical protein
MATRKRKKPSEKILYFYLNDKIHKALHRNRAEDLLIAWDYELGKRVAYSLTDVLKNKKNAYTITQAAKLIGRSTDTIKRHWRAGDIKKPQQVYTLDDKRFPGKFYFSEEDMISLHDFFKTVHRGRPRKDGMITTSNIPSRAELEALMRNEKVLYAKNPEGEFVPVWKQPEW